MIHYIVAIAILLASATVHWTINLRRDWAAAAGTTTVKLDLPERIGPFVQRGGDIDPGDFVRKALEVGTSDILMRNYTAPNGAPVLVTIVYAGQKKRSLHFPEVCLVGQGWEVQEAYTAPVGIEFEARRLVIFRGESQQAVLYWLKTGKRFTSSIFMNGIYWAREQLLFGTPTSSMIKLSMPILKDRGQNQEAAFAILDDFASQLGPILLENNYLD